jgi:hypothetical protein
MCDSNTFQPAVAKRMPAPHGSRHWSASRIRESAFDELSQKENVLLITCRRGNTGVTRSAPSSTGAGRLRGCPAEPAPPALRGCALRPQPVPSSLLASHSTSAGQKRMRSNNAKRRLSTPFGSALGSQLTLLVPLLSSPAFVPFTNNSQPRFLDNCLTRIQFATA